MTKFLIFLILTVAAKINGQFLGDSCARKNDNQPGICSFLDDCPSAKAEFNRGIRPQICSFASRRSIICCKKENAQNPTPQTQWTQKQPSKNAGQRVSVQKCEVYKNLATKKFNVASLSLTSQNKEVQTTDCEVSTSLIVGGEKTKTGEFPHMAAIGYGELNGIKFACGGSLISEKFVLTAAHCLRKKSPPIVVRLGDQNLKSTNDKAQPQEFGVKNYIKHESYKAKTNYYDIGLIELDGLPIFTKFVRPACLWQEIQFPRETATATGWGMLEYLGSQAEELQKVSLTLMQNQDCNPHFKHIIQYTEKLKQGIVDSQLCAAAIEGGRLVGGKDTCQGDSGGPLQITLKDNLCAHYVVGLTSFAPAGCGEENSPGVYTRVSEYIDWIESKVWS
jgi:secreted trypsin-like serine protease